MTRSMTWHSATVRTDVTNLEKLTHTFSNVVSDFGSINGCITAAGIVLSETFVEHGWDETLRVDLVMYGIVSSLLDMFQANTHWEP